MPAGGVEKWWSVSRWREPNRAQACANGSPGFALPIVLIVLALMTSLVVGGHFVAAAQFRIGVALPRASAAFYAAEAGLSSAVSAWDTALANNLAPGATAVTISGDVDGQGYEVTLTRLSSSPQRPLSTFLLNSIGNSTGAYGGRRAITLLVRAATSEPPCCEAAVSTPGAVTVQAGGRISGRDEVPESWTASLEGCDGQGGQGGDHRPGVLTETPGRVIVEPGGQVDGVPPVAQARERAGWESPQVERWFQELRGLADIEFTGGTPLSGIGAVLDDEGDCDDAAATNWGAPESLDHPCSSYFPVVFVAGDLRLEGPGAGQGILVVDGDLQMDGDFRYYGAVLTKERLHLSGGDTAVRGGVLVLSREEGALEVGGGAGIEYSSCALRRAVQGTELLLPRPLAHFAWLEILE